MSTTSAYGWNIPDNTDLVKDGALAIRTLGNAIDASMNTALGTKKAMGVLLNTISFSGVSSFSLAANTFTTTYDNYKILISFTVTGSSDITGRLRAAGSDITASNYNSALIQAAYGSTTLGNYNSASGNVFYLSAADGQAQNLTMEIMSPFLTQRTSVFNQNDRQGYGFQTMGGVYKATTSVDSFTVSSGGTMSGSYSVYGYNK